MRIIQLEPARGRSRAMMSRVRAAHLARWADGTTLQFAEKAIVLSVTTDPEPDDLIVL